MTAATKPGRALKPRDVILAELSEKYTDEIAALAPDGVKPEHYIASLRLYMAQNPKILDCSPVSVAIGVLRVAQTGLTLGVSCDLLPIGKTCQFSPRYGGLIELALGAGTNSVNADVVREGDDFAFEKGTKFFLRHTRKFKKDAKITHAYAIAGLRFGHYVFEVATREEIDALKAHYSQHWKTTDLDAIPWYAKKTMVRRLSPFLPKNARLAAALMFADAPESLDAEGTQMPDAEPQQVDKETGELIDEAAVEEL